MIFRSLHHVVVCIDYRVLFVFIKNIATNLSPIELNKGMYLCVEILTHAAK